jgi:glutamine synthetase
MPTLRLNALSGLRTATLRGNASKNGTAEPAKISAIYGERVFDIAEMKEYLPGGAYKAVLAAITDGAQIAIEDAETIAAGMRKWAMDHGATHYTHWFHPLTGLTAEKHDAFFKPNFGRAAQGVEHLTGRELIQQEPDASSFPNGGLRGTQEARGYTIWDPTSPAFILEMESGKTLYIPSVFVSYTGECLDYKGPLLKSMDAINKAVARVSQFFDPEVTGGFATLGWEQEYFLIDDEFYKARPDLVLAGRTIIGAQAAKGHGRADHYFGEIPERVASFMHEFEREAQRVGIPVRTRHNEVAPAQFECAPMFEELNVAVDHNLLLMGLMQRVAKKHGLRVIFHEKPFAGINGSGKHNNWSLADSKGRNLLEPGNSPATDLRFLTFFTAVIRAIYKHGNLLRASIASSGNEHRLGANEAPPAIISVFTGSYMQQVLAHFRDHGLAKPFEAKAPVLQHSIPKIPAVKSDYTDRNRTSPFPFTGNKFEFRAVGASATCSWPMSVLNTIMADALNEIATEVEKATKGKPDAKATEAALIKTLQRLIKDSEAILFDGDNYSDAWVKEAEKRGLANVKDTPTALDFLRTPEAKKTLAENGVLSNVEVEAFVHVLKSNYVADLETEANLMVEMMRTLVVPSATNYTNKLIENYRGLKELGLKDAADEAKKSVERISTLVEEIRTHVDKLVKALHKAEAEADIHKQAKLYATDVKDLMAPIRTAADRLELLVDDAEWRLPKYREILFLR